MWQCRADKQSLLEGALNAQARQKDREAYLKRRWASERRDPNLWTNNVLILFQRSDVIGRLNNSLGLGSG